MKTFSQHLKIAATATAILVSMIVNTPVHAHSGSGSTDGITLTPNTQATWLFVDAHEEDDQVAIEWATLSGNITDTFSVEVSKDGVNFHNITEVQGTGNNFSSFTYKTLVDKAAYLRIFRIRRKDANGNTLYSDLLPVGGASNIRNLNVTQNNGDTLHIRFSREHEGPVSVVITDLNGTFICNRTLEASAGTNEFRLSDTGIRGQYMYMATIIAGESRQSQKFLT